MNKLIFSIILTVFLIGIISANPIQELLPDDVTNLTVSVSETETFVDFYLDTTGLSFDIQNITFGAITIRGISISEFLKGINFKAEFKDGMNYPEFTYVHISSIYTKMLLDNVFSYLNLSYTCDSLNSNPSILNDLVKQYPVPYAYTGDAYVEKNGNHYIFHYDKGFGNVPEEYMNEVKKIINQSFYIFNTSKLNILGFEIPSYTISYDLNDVSLTNGQHKLQVIVSPNDELEVGLELHLYDSEGNEIQIPDWFLGTSDSYSKNIYLVFSGFPECVEELAYTDWTSWTNTETCQSNNFLTQNRNRVQYDVNNCGFLNLTENEYRETSCDYCTPNIIPTEWSSWTDNGVCQGNNLKNQIRSRTLYDVNTCGEVEPVVEYEYQDIACDYCTPNLNYTEWSEWENQGECSNNNIQIQNRSRVQYDLNSCNEIENQTFYEYQELSCGYYNYTKENESVTEIEGLLAGTNVIINFPSASQFTIPSNLTAHRIINITLDKENFGTIYFNVNKSLVTNKDKVNLYVLENSTWQKLATLFLNDTGTEYEYSAFTPHFSIFMIAEEIVVQTQSQNQGGGGSSNNDEDDEAHTTIITPLIDCEVGETKCLEVCDANDLSDCHEDLYVCNNNNKWTFKETCLRGCEDGECKKEIKTTEIISKKSPKGQIIGLILMGISVAGMVILIAVVLVNKVKAKKKEDIQE